MIMSPTARVFGDSNLQKINIGDLVRWHSLEKQTEKGYKENVGIVTKVSVNHRGGRDVAVAKIIPLGSENVPGHEVEIFLACLKVISKSRTT